MSKTVTIGGDRLGSGKKMKAELHGYGRSTHDLGYKWRSTMSCGTLVPFMATIGLPGDTHDIDLSTLVRTLPTNGPLFGEFKLQLDVFQIPIRLYNAMLHMNMLNVGMKMSDVTLPQVLVYAEPLDFKNKTTNVPLGWQQFDQSSLWAYLGLRGLGHSREIGLVKRLVNGIMPLAYYDIYKNYYANKQEEKGVYISKSSTPNIDGLPKQLISTEQQGGRQIFSQQKLTSPVNLNPWVSIQVYKNNFEMKISDIEIYDVEGSGMWHPITDIAESWSDQGDYFLLLPRMNQGATYWAEMRNINKKNISLKLERFPLSNIDDMRLKILQSGKNQVIIEDNEEIDPAPYYKLSGFDEEGKSWSSYSQAGLAIKTYQSDVFNNWVQTEWITGAGGINELTAIDVSSGKLTMDAINIQSKMYELLYRVSVSGGTFEDWVDSVYGGEMGKRCESPMYMGGLSTEIIFDEVVSQAEATNTAGEFPLGTLAGRGTDANKRKGGKVVIKVSEPCIIMGIVSITPRIDYSQGNEWYMRLKNMDQLHKPALDQIGFQDALTDNVHFADTECMDDGSIQMKSYGKQPAWIEYMTNYNKCYGNFAHPTREMFMTLNRQYEMDDSGASPKIKDMTTYIDPAKYNYAFANAALEAQNFWVQIGINHTARRVMSAKVIPNL